ncbi:MAG: exopolysaccharide biosynthesis polyprenyl glycosylphosphotransferase, partial [Candidatus Acidiferrales bacterium]
MRPLRWRRIGRVLGRYLVLFTCDSAALLTSAGLAYLFWARAFLDQPAWLYVRQLQLICLFPFFYAAAGLYPGFGMGAVETLRRLSHATSVSFLVLAAGSFAFKADSVYSRLTFGFAWLLALALVPLFRFLAMSVVTELRWWREPTVVFGTPTQLELTIRSLQGAFSLGYQVVGGLCADRRWSGKSVAGVTILGGLDRVPTLAQRGVTTVLAWDTPSAAKELARVHQQLSHIVLIREEGLLPLERAKLRDLGGVLGIEFNHQLLRRRNQFVKRTIDVVIASICLIGVLPIIATCGLLIKLVSPGPMFFKQEREGLNGRIFNVRKLRTMYTDAEARLALVLQTNNELNRQWRQSMKLPHDPRIIPVLGSLFRRFSLDELPQLWSVITGEMSLVGPRPFPEYHLRMLSPEFKGFRSKVRPGLTGMWQVMVRSAGGLEEQERFDTYYIRN